MRNVRGLLGATGIVAVTFFIPFAAADRVASRYYVTPLVTGGSFDTAFAINDRGQVTGGDNSGMGKPFLWSPASANAVNGVSVRLTVPLTTSSGPFGNHTIIEPGTGWGINASGQVSGDIGTFIGAFLWTPTTPNGSTGTGVVLDPSNTAVTAYRLNDYGQYAIQTNGQVGELFTPTAANGSTGSITTFSGTTAAFAINTRGDVGGSSGANGFIFRPTNANGTTGVTVALSNTKIWDLNNNGLAATDGAVLRISSGATPSIVQTMPTGTTAKTYAVNDGGVAVTQDGKAWSEADGLIDLTTRLEGYSGKGWKITNARDINTLGQIVGAGTFDSDGDPSTPAVPMGFLLTPLRDGDATIDQQVNFDDLLVLAKNYSATSGKTYRDGDFTGDGAVNFDDLLVLAKNYSADASTASSSLDSTIASDWALARSLVPEPGMAGAVVAISVAITPPRRRR